jgi:sugar phosphate permease
MHSPQKPESVPQSAISTTGLTHRVSGETTVLWVIWLTYGSFYFCRQNLSAAVPGLQAEGYDKTQIGMILGSLKIAYAVGQLVNGQLAERFPARWLLALGMLGSAALNVVFGLVEGLYFLIFIWACNGYFQALGWTPCMRVAANWIPVSRRGRALGIIGTSYQFMASVTYLVSGFSVMWLGWRGALYVPAVLLSAAAIHMLLFLRETPEACTDGQPSSATPPPPRVKGNFLENLRATLGNPALWVLAVSLMLLDACRYGYQDWGLAHLTEVQKSKVWVAAAKYAILPAGGIVGALLAGWLTDRYFAGRRAPVICGFLLVLGALTLYYDAVTQANDWGTVLLLFGIGLTIFGPQVLLVGTAPSDLARRGTAAAAAGFVNSMGYLGAYMGDRVTGYLAQYYGWLTATHFWAGCAFLAALVAAVLWNTGPGSKVVDGGR